MKASHEVVVYVEKHNDGTYWGTTENLKGVVTAFGSTLSELKKALHIAYLDYLELAIELEKSFAKDLSKNPHYTYKLDLKNFFKLVPELKISNIAKKVNINASLLRQYSTGSVIPSEAQANKVLNPAFSIPKSKPIAPVKKDKAIGSLKLIVLES